MSWRGKDWTRPVGMNYVHGVTSQWGREATVRLAQHHHRVASVDPGAHSGSAPRLVEMYELNRAAIIASWRKRKGAL